MLINLSLRHHKSRFYHSRVFTSELKKTITQYMLIDGWARSRAAHLATKLFKNPKNPPLLAWSRRAMCGNGLIIKRKFFSFATSRCVNCASSSKYILSGFMNFIDERGMWMKSILWKFQLCKLIFIIAQKFIARRFRAFNSDRNVFIKSTHLGDAMGHIYIGFWFCPQTGIPPPFDILA